MIEVIGACCCGFAIFIIGLLAIFYAFTVYNGLITLKNNIDKAWANIDVLLKQRFDLVPNLVNVVKGYMKHEKQTLAEIARLRTSFLSEHTVSEKAKTSKGLSDALKTIFAVSENYPDLKASKNFLELQKQITAIENQIADRREFYNDAVLLYNTRIKSIPDSIVAGILGMKEREYFKANEDEKKNVNVSTEEEE